MARRLPRIAVAPMTKSRAKRRQAPALTVSSPEPEPMGRSVLEPGRGHVNRADVPSALARAGRRLSARPATCIRVFANRPRGPAPSLFERAALLARRRGLVERSAETGARLWWRRATRARG